MPDPWCPRSRDRIRLPVAVRPLEPLPSLFLPFASSFAYLCCHRWPVIFGAHGPCKAGPLVLVPSHQGVRQNAVAMRLGRMVAVPLAGPVGLVRGFVASYAPFPDFF